MTSKNVTLKKAKNEQIINGLDQEIIATDAILSDLQLSKSEPMQNMHSNKKSQQNAKREQLLKQSIADAQREHPTFTTSLTPTNQTRLWYTSTSMTMPCLPNMVSNRSPLPQWNSRRKLGGRKSQGSRWRT